MSPRTQLVVSLVILVLGIPIALTTDWGAAPALSAMFWWPIILLCYDLEDES